VYGWFKQMKFMQKIKAYWYKPAIVISVFVTINSRLLTQF